MSVKGAFSVGVWIMEPQNWLHGLSHALRQSGSCSAPKSNVPPTLTVAAWC
jgi:hypothetical protein